MSLTRSFTATLTIGVLLAACSSSSTTTAPVTPGTPAQLIKFTGDAQTGAVGSGLPEQLVVEVLNQGDSVMAGVPVTWAVTAGSGSISSTVDTTNSDGLASVKWTLGSTGDNEVTATVNGISPVTFTATGQ